MLGINSSKVLANLAIINMNVISGSVFVGDGDVNMILMLAGATMTNHIYKQSHTGYADVHILEYFTHLVTNCAGFH
jgi:hypothetical protein